MDQKTVAEVPAKKSRKVLLIIVLVFVLAGGGGAGWYFTLGPGGGGHGSAHGAAATESKAPPQYYPLNPAFVVNLADEGGIRYLQVDISLMSRDPGFNESIGRHAPLIRNQLLMLFSQKQSGELRTRAEKERLQSDALAETRKILVAETGKPLVDALYFTSFVTQ